MPKLLMSMVTRNGAKKLQHLQPKISSKWAALYNNDDCKLTVCQDS